MNLLEKGTGESVIREMSLAQISSEISGKHIGANVNFNAVSTDTRALTVNALYVALVGEQFDGNEFVEKALEKGACAAVVSKSIPMVGPVVQVADTTKALGQIARLNRVASAAHFIAITGSQGKTTVKEMCASIMSECRKVLVTRGNFNNHIGVPLTLLEINPEHDCAVIELGASGLGEIAYTVAMVMPNVAVLTNAEGTHIEGFGDLDGVVRTKGEIIDGLVADGVAVLNADDPHFSTWKERAKDKTVKSFALDNLADYQAQNLVIKNTGGSEFTIVTPVGEIAISLGLAGRHNVLNALAAAAASIESGASLQDVQRGLAKVNAAPGRLQLLTGMANSVLIDDSYNASPSSFHAAIDVLAQSKGRKILVVGDMGELGLEAAQAHTEIGEYARDKGIDALWATGQNAVLTAQSFGASGRHFAQQLDLIAAAKNELSEGDTVLVKGSRSAAMERVVEQLKMGESL